jgi:hypothetical protein
MNSCSVLSAEVEKKEGDREYPGGFKSLELEFSLQSCAVVAETPSVLVY